MLPAPAIRGINGVLTGGSRVAYADFIHLRVHSAYSLLEGAIKIPALADLCKKHTMPAVAVTDTRNLFGALEFSMTMMKAGVQPIIGCELAVTREGGDPARALGTVRHGEVARAGLATDHVAR